MVVTLVAWNAAVTAPLLVLSDAVAYRWLTTVWQVVIAVVVVAHVTQIDNYW